MSKLRMLPASDYWLNPHSLPPLAAGFATAGLGIAAVVRERGSRASLAFLILMFSATVWLTAYAGFYASLQESTALFWGRVENVGVVCIPSALLMFTVQASGHARALRKLLWGSWAISGLFVLTVLFTPWFLRDVYHYSWGYFPHYRPFSLAFLAFFSGVLAFVLYLYRTELQRAASARHQKRLKAFLFAFSISYGGSVDYLAAYGVPVYPFGYVPVCISLVLLGHILWRYHFVDLTVSFAAQQILNTMQGFCLVTDSDGIIRIVNPAACQMLGYREEELTGSPAEKVISATDGSNPRTVWKTKQGQEVDVQSSVTDLLDPNHQPVGQVHVALDITERKKMEHALQEARNKLEIRVQERTSELIQANLRLRSVSGALQVANGRLKNLASVDPLTGLLNRRGLETLLVRETARARREGIDLLALLVDLDNFKEINDTLGHAAGDIVLKEMARRLKESLRATDYAARIGGDEFLILLPETRLAEGFYVAEKLRLAISEGSSHLTGGTRPVTGSFGAVQVSSNNASLEQLLADAHLTLHQSKLSGKNQVSFDPALSRGKTASSPLGEILRADQYYVVSQPIFQLADEHSIGAELLSRSRIPSFEMPIDFFRLCTEAHALSRVDQRCLQNCLEAGRTLPTQSRCHVNLFPSTLTELPAERLLEMFDLPKTDKAFCLEISEQQIIGDPADLAETVRRLKKAGLQIAIDDVGFGHSSLESLICLEPDILKIDKRCVRGLAQDEHTARALKRLLKISDSLGVQTIAEGIENRADFDCLRSLGVQYGQGFLWGEPQALPGLPL